MARARPVGLTYHLEHEDFVLERDDVLALYKNVSEESQPSFSLFYSVTSTASMDTPYNSFTKTTTLLPNIRNTNKETQQSHTY
jgi:hypothetical protein